MRPWFDCAIAVQEQFRWRGSILHAAKGQPRIPKAVCADALHSVDWKDRSPQVHQVARDFAGKRR
jgi:hypothetical protein